MHYREYPPRPPLDLYIRCFWMLDGVSCSPAPQTVPPDGATEIVFHLGDAFHQIQDSGVIERQAMSLMVGQLTAPATLLPGRSVSVAGIRFKPAGSRRFLRVPQSHFAGTILDLSALMGSPVELLRERLAGAIADRERIGLLEEWLVGLMRGAPEQDWIDHAVAAIENSGGLVAVDSLAYQAGVSRRHLERRFDEAVGIPAKQLARVVRFHRALASVESGTRTPWLELALDLGYYDQAHFIRDFRQFTGMAPTAYLTSKGATELASHFHSSHFSRPPSAPR